MAIATGTSRTGNPLTSAFIDLAHPFPDTFLTGDETSRRRRLWPSGATAAPYVTGPVILIPMPTDAPADLVLTGGRIFTADADRTWAEALAVRGGRVVAVGGDRDVRPLAGTSTRVIELRGRTVTPGFGDAHVHPPSAGLARLACELHGKRGPDEYLAAVAAYAAANPNTEWITGGGWSLADFPGGLPRREDLDRVVPGSSRVPPELRRARRLGQLRGACPGWDHEGHRGPRGWPDRPRHRWHAARHAPRGGHGAGGAAGPARDGG